MDFKVIFKALFIISLMILSLGVTLWLIRISIFFVLLLFPIALAFILAVLVTIGIMAAYRTVRN